MGIFDSRSYNGPSRILLVSIVINKYMEGILEFIIFITGATSIWLLAKEGGISKWGFVVGLIGQPCWVYTTITNGQIGLFFLTFIYTYSYCLGIYNHFIKKDGRKDVEEDN